MPNSSKVTTNISSQVDMKAINDLEKEKYQPTLIILVVLMITGLIGNTCVAVVYKLKLKRSSARVYIISLAMADVSVCTVGMAYHIYDMTHIVEYESAVTCKTLSFLISACTLSSVLILLLVGLDRYLKICRPLKRQIVDFGAIKACVIVVCLAIVISVPYTILYGPRSVPLNKYETNTTGVECFIQDIYSVSSNSYLGIGYLGFIMLLFIILVLFLIIIYSRICLKIHRSTRFQITIHKSVGRCFCCKVETERLRNENNCAVNTLHCNGSTNVNGVIESPFNSTDLSNIEITAERVIANNQPQSKVTTVRANDDLSIHSDILLDISLKTKPELDLNKIKHDQPVASSLTRHTAKGSVARERNSRKITMMMLTITVFFIVTYLPFIAVSVMDAVVSDFWTGLSESHICFYDFLLRIYVLNNVANPFIYSFWDVKFRRELKNFICKLLRFSPRRTINLDRPTTH
ncbi:D(2) dopamine receptor-like [Dreissena polymorpha]|uniref:G-protein coupled receptors family 1 profile domain-containing protein n=1 Tax=Dreissena polymorpha TaxID=45954 RepID=A0A9D3YYK8_DREPO|nr:D(2) dopamine receptor-like [Dreissena polymorpha]KAH3709513.1 hypothetical protein DPMN_068976 [Dreissena polymorpha]